MVHHRFVDTNGLVDWDLRFNIHHGVSLYNLVSSTSNCLINDIPISGISDVFAFLSLDYLFVFNISNKCGGFLQKTGLIMIWCYTVPSLEWYFQRNQNEQWKIWNMNNGKYGTCVFSMFFSFLFLPFTTPWGEAALYGLPSMLNHSAFVIFVAGWFPMEFFLRWVRPTW